MLQLRINSNLIEDADFDPNTTLLVYLRETLGLKGTKEGCASGDCGACTVISADCGAEAPLYQTVNACITPLGAVQGKQILTHQGHIAGYDIIVKRLAAVIEREIE